MNIVCQSLYYQYILDKHTNRSDNIISDQSNNLLILLIKLCIDKLKTPSRHDENVHVRELF